MPTNYKQIFARKKRNEQKILSVCPQAMNASGIYIMVREENGFKFAYIGQAVDVLSRLSSHLDGFQWIDNSIRSHGLYDKEKNPSGWRIGCIYFPKEQLDEKEQYYIKLYANAGYQMRNVTAGGQGLGKENINSNKPAKGYYDGVSYGTKKTKQKVKLYFDKYLDYSIKGKTNKIKERKLVEFGEFISTDNEGGDDEMQTT